MRFAVGQRVAFRGPGGVKSFGQVERAMAERVLIVNALDWDGRPMPYELDIGPGYWVVRDDGRQAEFGESELEPA